MSSGPGSTEVLRALGDALPPEALVTDPDIVDAYRYDRASTVWPGQPLAVVRATCTDDVVATMQVATRFRVPVVPRGAGTGLSGGASAVDGCITLSTERMRAITVDPAAMVVVAQPGLLNVEVKAAAREHGLWYPPDPSSFEICSIGGNLATNAGGLCCVRYGVTTDYVLGLEAVLADGRVVRLGGRTIKDVAGYDLKRLFVGSEGTLGIITEATLRLRPLPPPATTVAATFDEVVHAGHAVTRVMATMRPSLLELMDRAAIRALQKVRDMGFEESVGAVLLGQGDTGTGEAEQIAAACEAAGATFVAITDDPDEGEQLLAARRGALTYLTELGSVLVEDVAVPISRIPDLVAAVERVSEARQTLIPVVGHAGDGNLHPAITFDASDPDATARADAAFDDIMRVALDLGGTVTGEHGVGTLKSRHLAMQLGPDVLELTRQIKAALDPLGLLNPGKWV